MDITPVDLGALPAEVKAGLDQLFCDELYFVPIRHHSPACAFALQAMIRALQPKAVLIEGPDTFNELIPLLLDDKAKPPVAVLCQTSPVPAKRSGGEGEEKEEESGQQVRSAFFPFCDYSPEWVALQEGARAGAQLMFIDLPWQSSMRVQDDTSGEAHSLMAERYLAHSAYLNALAARTGCRDQDELWDHLFELRPVATLADWRGLFADVFAYCAMARVGYETAVLEAEGSLPRERHMAAHIAEVRKQVDGPIVIVTGGFHTLALLQLSRQKQARPATAGRQPGGKGSTAKNNWLIRYSFDRLDALNGYSAGMPSPAYYQWVWEALQQTAQGIGAQEKTDHLSQIAFDCLVSFAQQSRSLGFTDQISPADVQAAALQVSRLAALRGHAGPGRHDVLDAVRSCFIKGAINEGTQGMTGDLRRLMGGNRLGDIPPSAGSPPLLEDARRLARRYGIRLEDTETRMSRLDLYRKPAHRERSRFFQLMAYLDTGLAQWQGGPDFLGNSRLELMIEEWRHAWTPIVEARLIELAMEGATLADVALARLRREEELLADKGQARSANHAVGLLIRACLVGLHERLPALIALLETHLSEDENFGSVVTCGHRLATLWRAREPLGAVQHPELRNLLEQIWPAALFLLPGLANAKSEDEPRAVQQLLSLREFGRMLPVSGDDAVPAGAPLELFHAGLGRILAAPDAAAGVCGAAAALLFLDGAWPEAQLVQLLGQRFGAGAEPAQAVRFLSGLMAAAPELLLCQPVLAEGLNRMVQAWDEQTFLAHLADLRYAFTGLKPQETSDLADILAALNGANAGKGHLLAQTHYHASEDDMLEASRLQVALADCLQRSGLSLWLGESKGDHG